MSGLQGCDIAIEEECDHGCDKCCDGCEFFNCDTCNAYLKPENFGGSTVCEYCGSMFCLKDECIGTEYLPELDHEGLYRCKKCGNNG